MDAQEITLFIYNLAIIPVIFFSVLFLILSLVNIFVERKGPRVFKKLSSLPFISVQIPTFNDPIAERCVKQCMNFNYPKDKYEIIIVDDSTNIETQELLKTFARDNEGFIKYIHRDNRDGFKPGALKNAMKITKGEILVVFDADWIPQSDFLDKIIKPFSDPKVAIVQSRQGFYNKNTNLITRFAAYLLMVYHSIMMPINNSVNSVFFCGTAGALRRSTFEEAGGWNLHSITEDADLSANLLMRGYTSVYLDFETPSEVPDTFEGFLKQQMRWCYGNTRVFFDNKWDILFSRKLAFKQKIMILYITLGNIVAPGVVLMTLFGFSGWFLGDPSLFNVGDLITFFARFLFTAGFLVMGYLTLSKIKATREFPKLILSAFTVGLVIAVANSVAFVRAVFNWQPHWYCTPKSDNIEALK